MSEHKFYISTAKNVIGSCNNKKYWFNYCSKHEVPYIILHPVGKNFTVEFDYYTLPPRYDDLFLKDIPLNNTLKESIKLLHYQFSEFIDSRTPTVFAFKFNNMPEKQAKILASILFDNISTLLKEFDKQSNYS